MAPSPNSVPLIAIAFVLAASACTPVVIPPELPPTPNWLAFDMDVPGHDVPDGNLRIVRSFAARARSHGCYLERGRDTGPGWRKGYSTIFAMCGDEGTIAMEALDNGRVRTACRNPTTLERCETLLAKINEGLR
jgi:hypothetical protein